MIRKSKRFIARRTRGIRERYTPISELTLRQRAGDKSWKQMQPVFDRTDKIIPGDILLMTMSRDENLRIPHFLEYYRGLGVDHFLFVDNLSEDPVADVLASENDCTLWKTNEPYEDTRWGIDWMNAVLSRYAVGHWALTVDVDEYFVFPYMETRILRELLAHLDEVGKTSLFSLLIDMYPNGSVDKAVLKEGQHPLELASLFDGSGYYSEKSFYEGAFVRGGPRLRTINEGVLKEAPAMNKIPLVKWDRNYVYMMGTHSMLPHKLNHAHHSSFRSPTGALLHFKFLSTFRDKVRFAVESGNHFEDSKEYKKYQLHLETECSLNLTCGVSDKYDDSDSLMRRNLMTDGSWA